MSAPPLRASAAHVFVEDLAAPRLEASDRHHLERVLRLRRGAELTVSDGRGGLRSCRFGPVLEPLGEVVVEPAPQPPITVAFSLVKGDRPAWIVQKLTELGVDRMIPLVAARSVVRWPPEKAAGHLERLHRVAREAAMQCRRTWLPVLEPTAAFAELAARSDACVADAWGGPPSLARPTVLVGPEGGWDDVERHAPAPKIVLGAHVLRAETAAVTAAALLVAIRLGIVSEG
ncbi:MAG: RsmE family RNA methyltransferase [Acidimicrobiales bacterium]